MSAVGLTLPGMAYIHATSILLFGNTALGFRVLDVLVHIAASVLMFEIARRYLADLAALFASAILTLYYISEGFWLAGQPDGFAVTFLLLGTYLYLLHIERGGGLFVAGLAMAAAAAIRPTYALFGLSLFVVLVAGHRKWMSYVLGVLTILAAIILPYVFVPHGLFELYEAAIGFNISVYGGVRGSYDILNLLRHPVIVLALVALVLYGARTVYATEEKWSSRHTLLVLYAVSAFVSLYVMGKFLVYHFDPIFAIAAFLCGYLVARIQRMPVAMAIRMSTVAALAFYMLRVLYPVNLLHIGLAAARSDQRFLDYCYTNIKTGTDFGYATENALVRYVESRRPKCIELASISPGLLWRSEVPQASRFTMIHAIGMHQAGAPYTPFQLACQREYVHAILHERPDLFILSTQPNNLPMFAYQDPASIVRSIDHLDSLLRAQYTRDTLIGPYVVFARRAR